MYDPLRCNEPLPLRLLCYPLGYPLEIVSNSPLVIDAAAENWADFNPASDEEPVRIRIAVTDDDEVPERPPVFRKMGHLLSIVSSKSNFAVCDVQSGFAFAWLTRGLARDDIALRQRFLDGMVYCILVCRRFTPIHASCVSRDDQGLVLCGESGAGKSSLAFACALRGFTFVTDDVVYLRRGDEYPLLLGKPKYLRFLESAKELFPELVPLRVFTGPNGDPTIELTATTTPLIRTAYSAAPRAIVFLKRLPGAAPQFSRLSPEAAEERLLAGMPTFGDNVYGQFQRSVGILVRTTEVAEFRYWDLHSAVNSLLSFVRG